MPALHCNVTVLEHTTIAESIHRMKTTWPGRTALPRAGQFFMLRAWAADEAPLLSRPISVHSYDARTATVEFLYEVRGLGTQRLAALAVGDTLTLTGPSGNGFDLSNAAGRIAVVGGGIGTAPLYQLVKELVAKGVRPDVYLGFRDEGYGVDRFLALGVQVFVATDSGKQGFRGLVTQLLTPQSYDTVYCCGPQPMMQATAALCAQHGTPCIVSLEKKMACGVGACLGCTCHTTSGAKAICKDGPVFDAREVFA